MRTFNKFNILFLLAITIIQACQTSNPVQFGNRKFYPDPVKKLAEASRNKELLVESNTSKERCTDLRKNFPLDNSEIKINETQVLNSRNTNSLSTTSEKKLTGREKSSFKERIAFSILKHTAIAKANKVSLSQDNRKTPGGAIAGFILSLLGVFVAGLILGTLGVIFSAIALSKDSAEYKKGLAIAGLILGIIAIVGALIVIAAVI